MYKRAPQSVDILLANPCKPSFELSLGLQAPTLEATSAHSAVLPETGLFSSAFALATGWVVRLCCPALTVDDVIPARLRCSSTTRSAARDMRAITSSVLLLSRLAAAAHLPVANTTGTSHTSGCDSKESCSMSIPVLFGVVETAGTQVVSRCVISSDVVTKRQCLSMEPRQADMLLGRKEQHGVQG